MTDSPMDEIFNRDLYPDWVSDNALKALRVKLTHWLFSSNGDYYPEFYTDKDPNRERFKRVVKHYKPYIDLFKSKEMKYCWEKIERTKFETRSDVENQAWLARAFWMSLPHLNSKPKTKNELIRWKNKTSKALEAVRDLSNEPPIELADWYYLTKGRMELLYQQCNPTLGEVNFACGPSPFEILEAMLTSLDETEINSSFYRGAVNGKDASRTYFIRSLTCALLQDFGRPMNKLVSIAATVAFKKTTSERHVIRTKQDLDPSDFPAVVNKW